MRADSSSTPPTPATYGVRIVSHTLPARLTAGETIGARVTVENTGTLVWLRDATVGHPVQAVLFLDDAVFSVLSLPRASVEPGRRVAFHFALRAPETSGCHRVRFELAHQHVTWFAAQHVPALVSDLHVGAEPITETRRCLTTALAHDPWYYQPTQGIARAREGQPFPLFVSRASGCHVWDPEGHEYLDYTMSWGATILGHADPRIQDAIRAQLDSGAVPPFPHPVEMDVARMLAEDFPSIETLTFGKNGSDVCTVAARLARLSTGRRVILSCGFHGWQDFGLEYFDFGSSGIPFAADRSLFKFEFNDLEGFLRLYDAHRADLAAVMIEPAGPAGAPERGLHGEAAAGFLETIADAARRAQALLIFDEIVTAYRYPKRSVQATSGVIPDLTCLGKALASGMPLAAVGGRAQIFYDAFPRTHYCPTFRGEVYSLAAARAAIGIYRAEPVAERLHAIGDRVRLGINRACREAGLAAEVRGTSWRFGLWFDERDAERRQIKATIYFQELLKRGIVTVGGIMLPAVAHTPDVVDRTIAAAAEAIAVIAEAERRGTVEDVLEIPRL